MAQTLTSLEQIKQEVIEDGGVLTVTMDKLRNAYGASRLGRHVVNSIGEELTKQGLSFISNSSDGQLRDTLPNNQWDVVRLYIPDSHVGRLIIAAYNIDKESDDVLRGIGSEINKKLQEAEEEIRGLKRKMDEIRDIVCD